MFRNQRYTSNAKLRAEKKALRIEEGGLSLPAMIAGFLALLSTASTIASLASL